MKRIFLAALTLLASPVPAVAQVAISGLPAATIPLSGTEVVPIVQGGVTKKATVSSIATGTGSQSSNTVLAAPNGSSGVPTFRVIVAADVPTLNQSTTGSAATLTTPRTITTTGDLSHVVTFDGSANVTAAGTIAAGAVSLAKMANLPANTFIGNNTGIAATPLALTTAQATAALNNFTSTLAGLAPASGGGTTNFLRADGTWTTPGGGGTVTSASVVSANGFAGTVATATTTPAITISTTATGILKGNGTAISAATAATDYVAPAAYASTNGLTMATGRLLGRTTAATGAAEEITVGSGLTLSGGTITATGGGGTVTSVAALTLGTTGTDLGSSVATGTTTPVITLNVPSASAANRGALLAADWTAFNGKQAALVSGTNIKTVNGTSLLGSGDVGVGVTSVGGTGTVNGLTLTGTVTSTGNLTLGGTLDLSSPPAIGGTTAAAITGTTITANTAFAGPHNGTVGATTPNTGSFTTLAASSTVSGTGFSTYLASPPAIGGTAAAAGSFTALGATGLLTTAASATGSAGIRLPHGAAPTTPTNGDLWTTTTGLFARINGATVGPYGSGGGSPGGSTTQLQYNNAGAFGGASGITTTGTELAIVPAANAVPLTVSGYSVTGSGTSAMVSTAGTLNTTGIVNVDFQNITNTASNASSTLFRRQVGGVDKFTVDLTGIVTSAGGNWTTPAFGATTAYGFSTFGGLNLINNNVSVLNFNSVLTSAVFPLGWGIGWAPTSDNTSGAGDLFLGRRSAANLRLGKPDAAAPVAQTISVQSVVAGTTNTAGVTTTLTGSQGTGTGAGGDIVQQIALPGTTGTAQNPLVNAFAISGTTGAFGYVTGIGGAVTQITSRTTGVTINKPSFALTLVSAAGTTSAQSITITDSAISATDAPYCVQKSGTDTYRIATTAVAAGSFRITYATDSGTTTEQPVFKCVNNRGAES